jgi:chromate reductase
MYNGDVEALGDPDPVAAFKRAIAGADALLIATPEYNHCVPGMVRTPSTGPPVRHVRRC